MENIRRYFESIAGVSLTDEDWEMFASKLVRQDFPKKHVLLKSGKIEPYLSFVESGIFRFYHFKDEHELTFAFAFEGEFMSGYSSFLTQSPSHYHIESLTPATLWRIGFDDLQSIYLETAIGNLIGRKTSEGLFLQKSKREFSLLTESAEQRYLNLFSEQAHLVQQIPLKYLASYIGVTPQALSRIRKRLASSH